jgi:predicted nucleotidyltransferase
MSNIYKIDLNKIRLENLKEVFNILEDHLSKLEVNFYLIGAVAKDMWMSGVHDVILGRVTNDLDIAVFVENADQYEILKTELINTGRFSALKPSRYTFLFDGHTQIDMLPFGGLNIDGFNLSHSIALTAIPNGFAEVFEKGTAQIEIQGQNFAVSTLPGIVLLKLIAYDDRPENRYKDLKDIANIVEHYDRIMDEVLFEENYVDLLEIDSRLTISAQ